MSGGTGRTELADVGATTEHPVSARNHNRADGIVLAGGCELPGELRSDSETQTVDRWVLEGRRPRRRPVSSAIRLQTRYANSFSTAVSPESIL